MSSDVNKAMWYKAMAAPKSTLQASKHLGTRLTSLTAATF